MKIKTCPTTTSCKPAHDLLLSTILCLLLVVDVASSAKPCHEDDQIPLLAIKYSFHSHPYFSNWIPGTACCNSWNGVGCSSAGTRVTALTIAGDKTLEGYIPPQIGNLTYLTSLLITGLPNVTGNIPYSFSYLKRLSFLSLSKNSLSGRIPSFLSKLASLTFLSLSHNHFSGAIPPSLANLRSLGALDLSHNKLTGSIPDSFGTFDRIQPGTLYLSHNHLSGPIPRSLGRPEWPVIDVSGNALTGDASFLFGAGKATLEMDLSKNKLSFDLTRVAFPVNLTKLDLSHNQIYGSIPPQINLVTGLGLDKFDVSYNKLCGKIPGGVVTSKFGETSYVGNQCLCGAPLPACK